MLTPADNIHEKDRLEQAKRLGLTLATFDRLLTSANHAYTILRDLGPFYGQEEIKEPTFRITASPVLLPKGSDAVLSNLGNDLLALSKALQKLPEEDKNKLGPGVDFSLPFTWRLDLILSEAGEFKVNEIEGVDGANALMIAEQLAYGLQTLEESTVAKLVATVKVLVSSNKRTLKFALLRPTNPHWPNGERFVQFINDVGKGTIHLDHLNVTQILEGATNPDWSTYDGILNESYTAPEKLLQLGIKSEQLLLAGNFGALTNKGTFALFFDPHLASFWQNELGKERFDRLTKILIPTRFITSEADIDDSREKGHVVKVFWVGENTTLINRGKAVALPIPEIEHGSHERWQSMHELFKMGAKLISQDFIMPVKMKSFLRKKATNLEAVEWYNRICAKYVVAGNPANQPRPQVNLTATEVTLGPDIVPAGRKCAFTAGAYV